MNNKLTICIPTYNRANYLAGCLQNIIPQARKFNVAIYISDNASTDNTAEVVENYKNQYQDITYFKNNENVGAEKNFVSLLRHAATSFVWVLSDDDRLVSGAVETVLMLITTGDYSMLVVNGGRKQKHGINGRVTNLSSGKYSDKNFILAELGWHMTWVSCLIFSRQMIQETQFEKYYGSELMQFSAIFNSLPRTNHELLFEQKPLVCSAAIDPPSWYPKAFEIFGKRWRDLVLSLPPAYSCEAKSSCIKKHGTASGLFGFKKILILRLLGYYNLSVFRQYKDLLEDISDLSPLIFYLIAVFPVPMVLIHWFHKYYPSLMRQFIIGK